MSKPSLREIICLDAIQLCDELKELTKKMTLGDTLIIKDALEKFCGVDEIPDKELVELYRCLVAYHTELLFKKYLLRGNRK